MARSALKTRERGQRIDDAIPDTGGGRSLSAPYPSWPSTSKTIADYWHRLTLPGHRKLLACDCGREFDWATELEAHQRSYRHPRLTWDKA